MSKKTKKDTFIYHGLGFPIRLVNVPMKKVFGEWALDINFNNLQIVVLKMLVRKPTSLTGNELRFIMGYLGMSTRKFSSLFDVSHVTIMKWLREDVKMNPNAEICLRLFLLDYLRVTDKEFKKLYLLIRQKHSLHPEDEDHPLEIDTDKIAC